MDNHIDPKMTAILTQLDKTKDSVIAVGRGTADNDRESHATIQALRKENELLMLKNLVLHDHKMRDDTVVWVSTVSMIIGWAVAATCFAGWMLS